MPDFFIIWSIGPSCLIGPLISFVEKALIRLGPIKNTIIRDVIKDKPVLNVRYLNTFKKKTYQLMILEIHIAFCLPVIKRFVIKFKPVAFDPLIIK